MKNIINYDKVLENSRFLLKEKITRTKLKSLVLGISGGVDSAIVAAIAKPICDELNIPLIGRYIHIESNKKEEKERAEDIGKAFCTDFQSIDLTEYFDTLKNLDEMDNEGSPYSEYDYQSKLIRLGNIKARTRMIYLYNLASKNGGLVLGTDNLTEYYLGFWTLHGDVGDFGLIQNLWKSEVHELTLHLAKSLNEKGKVLVDCAMANATDGLGISETDLEQIMPDWKERHNTTASGYSEIDKKLQSYLKDISKGENISKYNNDPVIERHRSSFFKRINPESIDREELI